MKVQIKQTEIEAAIRASLQSQGLRLQGKTVTIEFTAGRKESGLTADIDISDNGELPEFFNLPEGSNVLQLAVNNTLPSVAQEPDVVATASIANDQTVKANPVAEAQAETAVELADEDRPLGQLPAADPVVKKSNIFG